MPFALELARFRTDEMACGVALARRPARRDDRDPHWRAWYLRRLMVMEK
jgi:hypothetical protein